MFLKFQVSKGIPGRNPGLFFFVKLMHNFSLKLTLKEKKFKCGGWG